jgi:hypothetical protein
MDVAVLNLTDDAPESSVRSLAAGGAHDLPDGHRSHPHTAFVCESCRRGLLTCFGRIDRRMREVAWRLDALFTLVNFDS